MNTEGVPAPTGPEKAMAWLKVAAYAVGLILTVGGLVAGVAYGNYEKDQNADLTKRLSAWDDKQAAWDQKWSASQDQIQKLQQQLLDVKQQDISCKSSGANWDELQKSYGQCQASLSDLQHKDNAGILDYVDKLNQQMMSIENDIDRLQGTNGQGTVTPSEAVYLEEDRTEQASLAERIKDAQKRLICPG